MFRHSVKEKFIRKDSWVKELVKTYDPELLSKLIQKRIEFPASTGPYISSIQEEFPTDIIDAFIDDSEQFREKIEPAIGLILYNMMHNKLGESHEILRGVFSMIRESRLINCSMLVFNWLKEKSEWRNTNDVRSKFTYREGMMAFASVQNKNVLTENWWKSIWQDNDPFWWTPAFFGLRVQNPESSAKELQLLMRRRPERISVLLVGMWHDLTSREHLEYEIKGGLRQNAGWAGEATNILYEKLAESDKSKLLENLRKIILKNDSLSVGSET